MYAWLYVCIYVFLRMHLLPALSNLAISSVSFTVQDVYLPHALILRALGVTIPRIWTGNRGGPPRSIIISNNVQIYEVRTLSKSRDFRNIKNCIQLNKNSGDDTFNPVLCASVCWNFRTQETPNFKARTRDLLVFKPDWSSWYLHPDQEIWTYM